MAVSNPQQVNLAPSYANIIEALKSKAEAIQTDQGGPMSSFARGLSKGLAENLKNRFQKTFEEELRAKMEDRNKVKITEDDAKQYSEQFGIPYESIKPAIGIAMPPAEREEFIGKVISRTREEEGFRLIKESVGKEGGMTNQQYIAFLAAGDDAKKALAQQTFQKAASSATKFQNVEHQGVSYPVPTEMYAAALEASQKTNMPIDNFINFGLLKPAGYKATVTKNPRTGETMTVAGSGRGATDVTGPAETPENVVNVPDQLTPYERDQIAKMGETGAALPTVKKGVEALSTIKSVQNLMLQNISATTESLKSQTARAIATEVGRLTEDDVNRASGSQSIARSWKRWTEKLVSGKMAPEDRAEFLIAINSISDTINTNINSGVDAYVDRQARRFDKKDRQFDRQFLRGQMGLDYKNFKPSPVFRSIEDAETAAKKKKFSPGDKVIILTGKDTFKEAIWEDPAEQ